MTSKLDRYIQFMPPELKAGSNPNINMLLSAWAAAAEDVQTQLNNTKMQLFVKTAEGKYLDLLASNVGVSRPTTLGILDSDFQNLIPNLSLKSKQIVRSFYDVMDVFWGPTYSRANINALNVEPFAITTNHTFSLQIDGGAVQSISVKPGDVKNLGFATTSEVLNILNRFTDLTASSQLNPGTGQNTVNIRTNTPGPRGSIKIISGFGALGLASNSARITDLAQRTVLYQVSPGEILIELPAIVPTLRRTLKGSHHFHADATLEAAIPPSTLPWVGSFVYARTQDPFLVTGTKALLQQSILAGSLMSQITVNDTSAFPSSGTLIFDFGKSTQEQPVRFFGASNSQTLLIDPGHVFSQNHSAGAAINVLAPGQTSPYAPREDGSDYAIYLTSPSNARTVVESILNTLQAAGIVVTFVVLLPKYRYLLTNPYA